MCFSWMLYVCDAWEFHMLIRDARSWTDEQKKKKKQKNKKTKKKKKKKKAIGFQF